MQLILDLIKKNQSRIINYSIYWVPLLVGVWSVIQGQDRSSDLANYHLYNGFSFLNEKTEIDFGVAGLQTYFNPLIDTLYYFLNTHLYPPFFGFLIGIIHGLNFILLFKIIEIIIKPKKVKGYSKLIFFLSISGLLTSNFISVIGSSSGDNLTSIFVLLSLLLMMKTWGKLKKENITNTLYFLASGILIGIGVTLKLTNIIYAAALCSSLIIYPGDYRKKIKVFIVYAISALIGFVSFGGLWYLKIFNLFQNPFFPIFDGFFNDSNKPLFSFMHWGPNSIIEAFAWPFIITFNTERMAGGQIHQILWLIAYLLLIIFLIKKFILKNNELKKIPAIESYLILFLCLSFFIWMKVFSVQRYLIPAELLSPAIIFILYKRMYKNERFIKSLLLANIILVLLGGFGNYGHTAWQNPPFKANLPRIANSSKSTVIIPNEEVGWLVTLFPKDLAFIRIDAFENKYNQYALNKIYQRPGKKYCIFHGYYFWRLDNVKKWSKILSTLNLLSSKEKCEALDSFINRIKFRGKITYLSGQKNVCEISLKDEDFKDQSIENIKIISNIDVYLKKYNFNLKKNSCTLFKANFGTETRMYNWCQIE